MLEETLVKWHDQIAREALEKGRLEGTLTDRRQVLIEQMTARFGRLPKTVREQLESITSYKALQKLTRKVLSAKSLADMGFG